MDEGFEQIGSIAKRVLNELAKNSTGKEIASAASPGPALNRGRKAAGPCGIIASTFVKEEGRNIGKLLD